MAQTTGIAIGENATASAVNSIAIGDNTTAAAGHVALNTFDTMDAQGNIIPARLGAVTGGLSFLSSSATTADIIAAYNAMLTAMGKIPPPYDAEIEYLQGDKTAFIDSGFVPGVDSVLEIDYMIPSNYGSASWDTIADVNPDDNTSRGMGIRLSGSYISTVNLFCFNSAYSQGNISSTTDQRHHAVVKQNVVQLDETTKTISSVSYANTHSIYLFAENYNGTSRRKCACRIYSCRLYDGQTLMRDFVPVRVGQVGYMFDRVSGQLFGNAGTGSFVLGPDV